MRLWGSIYDDAILDAIDAGQAHPTLKETISPAVTTFRAGQLAQAVNQAQVVVSQWPQAPSSAYLNK